MHDIHGLVGGGLQGGAGDVAGGGETSQAGQHAAGVGPPVGGVEAGEGRYEIDVAIVGDGGGQCLDVGAVLYDTEVVAQPLDQGTGDGDGTLQRVGRGSIAQPSGDGGDQAVVGGDGDGSRVHEQKTAGAVCVLGLPRLETGLAHQRGLLVSEDAGDGNTAQGGAVDFGGGCDSGQDLSRDAEGR